MTQLDMFFTVPAVVDARCGLCVHRNAPTDAAIGACTPIGYRAADAEPCVWFFGREQLNAAPYGRRAA